MPRTVPRPPQRLNMPALATAWRAMGLRGAAPRVYVSGRYPNYAGWQQPGNRDVYLSPKTAAGLRTLGFPGHRNLDALRVLAHEYAHVGQARALNRGTQEGGAEAYAHQRLANVFKALGIVPREFDRQAGWTYMPETLTMVRKPLGAVRAWQFGRR